MAIRQLFLLLLIVLSFASSSFGRIHFARMDTSGYISRNELQCPEPTGFGICVDKCTSDSSCIWPLKCCSNGCGHVCTMPVTSGENCVYKKNIYKNGQIFLDDCNTCYCRKGRVSCTEMACNPKPGECPKPETPGICIHGCTSDWSCPGTEKCCFNGCGHVCTKMDGGHCYVKGKTYKNGETFKDVCNTCWCGNGTVACTLMACGSKLGKCPKTDTEKPEKPGVCRLGCSSDFDCPSVNKCCSVGCNTVCMKPIGELSQKPNCSSIFCPTVFCDGQFTPPGQCCSICPPSVPSL